MDGHRGFQILDSRLWSGHIPHSQSAIQDLESAIPIRIEGAQASATARAPLARTGAASVVRTRAISVQLGNSGQRTHSFQILCGSSALSIRWNPHLSKKSAT